jgi:hypothetical protein
MVDEGTASMFVLDFVRKILCDDSASTKFVPFATNPPRCDEKDSREHGKRAFYLGHAIVFHFISLRNRRLENLMSGLLIEMSLPEIYFRI